MTGNFFKSIGMSRAVLALSFARMADAMGNSILFVVLPLYVAKIPELYFHFALPVMVGILLSFYGFVNSALQPFMGALSDRLGKRKLLIIAGLALMGAGTVAFVAARHFWDLLILRMMQGVGVAVTVPASMALMASITEKESRGGAMGIYSTLRVVGFSLGPLIGGYVKVHWGFNAAFLAGGGFIFLAMLMVFFWVKDVKVDPAKKPSRPFKWLDFSLLEPGIASAALATFIMAIAFSVVTTLENEFNARLDMTAFGFGIAFSALMVGRLLFQVPLGRLSDHIGRKPLVMAGLIFLAPVTAVLGETQTMFQLVVLRVFQGIATAGIAAPAFAVAADLSRSGGEGRQMSVITMGFGLGLALGPLLAGLLAVVFFELPFLVAGILALAGAWIVLRYMPETVHNPKSIFRRRP